LDLRAIFLPAQKLTAIISVAQNVNANERINVDMMLNQSIQRWEYEGGRIVTGGTGFVAGNDAWFQGRPVETSENAETKKESQSEAQNSN
jgi:hypothetical protein